VGTYQIVEQIGIGGMGEVYRAFRATINIARSGDQAGAGRTRLGFCSEPV